MAGINYTILITAFSLSLVGLASGAKILFFIGISSYSHREAIQPLITKMVERGHEVSVFSPIKPETPNVKVIELCTDELAVTLEAIKHKFAVEVAVGRHKEDPLLKGNNLFDIMLQRAETILSNPVFTKWIQNSTFDLIVHDYYGSDYMYAIAHQMKSKVISFLPSGCYLPMNFELWGLPLEPWSEGVVLNKFWWLPNFVYNAVSPFFWHIAFTKYYLPKVEAITRNTLVLDFPPLLELTKKFDLILTNQHFSHTYSFSYPPYVVPVGGMHVKESNGTLSWDLEEFVRGSDDFVFISFGSIVRVSSLPVEIQQTLFDAVLSFSNTRFLWKWEGDIPNNLPKNVFAKNWFSQQDILAHPKCKGFVTHGGMMSIQQAIYHKVPVVVVPGFGDQPYNAQIALGLGVGTILELADVTSESFSGAIRQILENNTYAENIKKVSERFRDRPMSALDTAVWWTEYVLRHDTAHLKSDGFRQTWWQRRSLDFWFLAFTTAFISTFFTLIIIFMVIRKVVTIIIRGKCIRDKVKTT